MACRRDVQSAGHSIRSADSARVARELYEFASQLEVTGETAIKFDPGA
jgi:hypothetical protein